MGMRFKLMAYKPTEVGQSARLFSLNQGGELLPHLFHLSPRNPKAQRIKRRNDRGRHVQDTTPPSCSKRSPKSGKTGQVRGHGGRMRDIMGRLGKSCASGGLRT